MGNFHALEVVGRGSETQLQVGENLNLTQQVMGFDLLCRPNVGRTLGRAT